MSLKINDFFMQKTAISHRFHIIPKSLLKEYLQKGILPFVPEGSHEVSALGPVIFSQEPETDDHGVSWSQSFAATSDDRSLVRWNGARAYIAFHMTDGSVRLVGNGYSCPLITVTPHAGAVRISAKFQAFEPVRL